MCVGFRLSTCSRSDRERATVSKAKGTLVIEQVRSVIGRPTPQRESLRSMGLRRIGHRVERPDTPHVRGAIKKVEHLVRVTEVDRSAQGSSREK